MYKSNGAPNYWKWYKQINKSCAYLRDNELHLVVSVDLSRDKHLLFGRSAVLFEKLSISLAFFAELESTAGSTTRSAVFTLACAGIFAQLTSVADSDVRSEQNEQVAVCRVTKLSH